MDLKQLDANNLTADIIKEARDKLDRVRFQHYVDNYNEAIVKMAPLDISQPSDLARFAEFLEVAHNSLKQLESDAIIKELSLVSRAIFELQDYLKYGSKQQA